MHLLMTYYNKHGTLVPRREAIKIHKYGTQMIHNEYPILLPYGLVIKEDKDSQQENLYGISLRYVIHIPKTF